MQVFCWSLSLFAAGGARASALACLLGAALAAGAGGAGAGGAGAGGAGALVPISDWPRLVINMLHLQ